MLESLTKMKKLERAKKLFEDAVSYDRTWQREAFEDFKFRDGEQWPKEEKLILQEELRPCLTFNLTKSSIDLIMGMNEDNRKKFRASPVEPSDAFLAEILNDISEYICDSSDFTDEEDAALESAAICGRGYVAIDFVPDPIRFGEIQMNEVAISIHEVHFDPSARRPTLEDASYICWDRWLTKQDFQLKYPKVAAKEIDNLIAESGQGLSLNLAETPPPASDVSYDSEAEESDYDTPLNENDYIYFDTNKNMIRVIHMEYWETYKRYFGFNPETQKFEEFTGIPLSKIKADYKDKYGVDLEYEILMDKKVKWLQFTGDKILYDDGSPLPYNGFSIVPCFAYRDVSGRTANHFGVVRLMKDPQREVNKRWSQALNMLNQQVQPGLYAELDAFVNNQQAEIALKEAGSIAWTQPGALSSGKIQERTIPSFPNAPMQMEQFSQDIMKKITGINPDLLGQDRGRQEAGVVIRLRQQQGLTLLKPLFKSFNKMKKELFKRQLSIIMAYMSDSQILRILGQGDRYNLDKNTGVITDKQTGLQAMIRDVRNLEYNLSAEEAPGNMTKRMLEISTYMEMKQAGFLIDPVSVIEKLELSATEKDRWLKYIDNVEKSQSQQTQQAMQAEMQFRDREISIDEQRNLIQFITSMAKVEQMSDKDKMKLMTEFIKLDLQNKSDLRTFMSNMYNILSELEKNKADNLTALLSEQIKGEKQNASKNSDVRKKPESNN